MLPREMSEIECDCEHVTKFDWAEPHVLVPVQKSVKCERCGSIYLVVFKKMRSGRIRYTLSLTVASRGLVEFLAKKRQKEIANMPQKKAPQFFV